MNLARPLTVVRSWNSSKNSSVLTNIGYRKSQVIACISDPRSVLKFAFSIVISLIDGSYTVGTQKAIGVAPPNEALLFVICSPVGPYYPNGFKPVALYGTTDYIRAAPGGTHDISTVSFTHSSFISGTGAYKLGVNYAPGVMPQRDAASKGYVQNLWLHGPEHYLTEVRVVYNQLLVNESACS